MLVHAGTDITVRLCKIDEGGNALPLKPIEIHIHRLQADWGEALQVIQVRVMEIAAELLPPPDPPSDPALPVPLPAPARRRKRAKAKE